MRTHLSFGRYPILLALLLFWGGGAAFAEGDDPVITTPPIPCEPSGFGFLAQADRGIYASGDTLHAYLALYNNSCTSVWGYPSWGGIGCGFDFQILDSQGQVVHQENGICPMYAESSGSPDAMPSLMPIGPAEFPHGALSEGSHDLALTTSASEGGEPDGTPLPVGNYMLRAVLYWAGPAASGEPGSWDGAAGYPEARIPFRIDRGTVVPPVSTIPFETVDQGQVSFYHYGDPTFAGEDRVITTPRDWRYFWRSHSTRIFPPPPTPWIDFSQRMVLATLMGYQSYGGASITITKVVETANQIRVSVRHDLPGAAIDMIANPFHIVTIPRSDKELVFVHETGYPPPPVPCCVAPAEGVSQATAPD